MEGALPKVSNSYDNDTKQLGSRISSKLWEFADEYTKRKNLTKSQTYELIFSLAEEQLDVLDVLSFTTNKPKLALAKEATALLMAKYRDYLPPIVVKEKEKENECPES
ncbi:hypothetical protein [Thermoactinomyces sp. DSM 45892]|uniref:hypothetical protein n=1 Tax=Thermoactinomyces sp. DSM 45892 TaxID=1882753 RepID=UPI00089D62DA|nr:hypothetical protein [Thermoactinomyces sp. DSM 45892]SDY85308.1 hypothetical protein SAMN05444416_10977 [Thermoactinomyces sp. DSM 45892]